MLVYPAHCSLPLIQFFNFEVIALKFSSKLPLVFRHLHHWSYAYRFKFLLPMVKSNYNYNVFFSRIALYFFNLLIWDWFEAYSCTIRFLEIQFQKFHDKQQTKPIHNASLKTEQWKWTAFTIGLLRSNETSKVPHSISTSTAFKPHSQFSTSWLTLDSTGIISHFSVTPVVVESTFQCLPLRKKSKNNKPLQ